VHGKWDLAVLVNLEPGPRRPGDLMTLINGQAEGVPVSWKVLTETLRRLERVGYVGHREVSRLPRVTFYWLEPAGRGMVRVLASMDESLAGEP
jgi:DNA-binding HxlR family transcriptional regulator